MGDLAERLADGDSGAFAELYDACADRLHHYLVVRLRSSADADDLVQETFVRLARTRHKLGQVENIVAYLFTIAQNESARLLSRRSREGRAAIDAAALFSEATSGDELQREAAESLSWALEQLTGEQREIVELKTWAGLTLREIADVTGLPPGTVATRYRTAIQKLRNWLTKKCHE